MSRSRHPGAWDGAFYRVRTEHFEVTFVPNAGQDLEALDNVDVFVDLPRFDERIAAALSGEGRTVFLLDLGYEVAMAERGLYRAYEGSAGDAMRLVPFYNELRLVLQNQLRADLTGASTGYPGDQLVAVLRDRTVRAGMADAMDWLAERACRRIKL